MRVVGVDGCKGGWVSVTLGDGAFAGAAVDAGLDRLLDRLFDGAQRAEVVAVDMPLGLLDEGWRRADTEAAGLLGRLRQSVFRVPPRPVWSAEAWATANARCLELTGSGLSRQTWGLGPKLREANALLDSAAYPLREVHPEVSFWAMAGREPLSHGKKSWAGQARRRRLLLEAGIRIPEDLGEAGRAAPDDVLDAAAAAWSAERIARGRAGSLPDPPQRDRRGRAIAIWY